MSGASFERLATVTASTKRSPAVSGGKRSGPSTNIASLMCTPLDPVDAELRDRLIELGRITAQVEVVQSFVDDGLDIVEGDILTVSGTDYPIRAVAEWKWRETVYKQLVLEVIKR